MKECLQAQLKLQTRILGRAYDADDWGLVKSTLDELRYVQLRLAKY